MTSSIAATLRSGAAAVWTKLAQGGRTYLAEPVQYTLRFIAVVILVQAGLSVLGGLLRWPAIQYFDGIPEILVWVLVAWLLTGRAWGRVLIGVFLLVLFVVTVVLVLLPEHMIIQQLADIYLKLDRSTTRDWIIRGLAAVWREGAPFVFTLLMGALGSSVMITRQFMRDFEGREPVWYLYRVTQGMLMALLVIYGIAAGAIGIGQDNPIRVQNYDENKYMIGFVAALAGLFSEQAFLKLHDVAKSLFGKEDPVAQEDAAAPGAQPQG